MSIRALFQASLEADATGEKKQEIEYCFYLLMTDFKDLEHSVHHILQEQWELFHDAGDQGQATIRVRGEDGKKFILCTKLKKPGVLGKEEVEVPTTVGMMDHFKILAKTGLRKKRYIFPIEGGELAWEVDVFEDAEGNPYPWVKLDLEVPAPLAEIPPFPVQYSQSITAAPSKRTEAEAAFIRHLFDDVFNLKTPPAEIQALAT